MGAITDDGDTGSTPVQQTSAIDQHTSDWYIFKAVKVLSSYLSRSLAAMGPEPISFKKRLLRNIECTDPMRYVLSRAGKL